MKYLLSFIFWSLNIFQSIPTITFPLPGDALQGIVTIVGTTEVISFDSSEISFTYSENTAGPWFLISKSEQPVQNGNLCEWDTALISDGDYDLRLRTFLTDGSYFDILIEGLRIRNYTPVENPLAIPTPSMPTSPTDIPNPMSVSATPNPPDHNPMEMTTRQLYFSLGIGLLVSISIFLLISVFIKLRWK